MKILMAAGVPKRREGGVAAIIYNLGRELESSGHEVSYVFYEDLLSHNESRGRFRDLRFAIRLSNHIRKHKTRFDAVNLHAPTGFVYGVFRRLMHSHSLPPYVMTLHGLEERRVHVMAREARKGKAFHFSLKNRLWHRAFHRPRFYFSIKTADRTHCYSRDVWTILQLKYNLDAEKTAYIPSGVEERFFISREYQQKAVVRLLYAGSWLDQRGIFYIRDALVRLATQRSACTFTIAGSGASEEGLKSFFGETLRDKIVVRPMVPAERMPALYAEHDIFLFPSLMEGLPSVLLEAMATGMPVITTETCGMTDVVADGVNGLLIPPANSEALLDAIVRLCGSTELRRELGMAAQESMRRFTWKDSAQKLERLFESALRNGNAPLENR
ncbi:MAG TPA: glycosyltransferase family 4 protein [Candidatus Acidoferrales bacterium]|nr:glycosyltransferase family 4 protein [Candidatus Acidoferrales bacterium]